MSVPAVQEKPKKKVAKKTTAKKPETKPRKKPGEKQDAGGRSVIRVGKGTAAILANPDDVSSWDDEELVRGYRKDKNGKWTGRPPSVIPSVIHRELTRRRMSEAKQSLTNNLVKAVDTLATIATNVNADDHARIKAAGMIMERVMGKPKETIEITGEEPKWLQTLNVAIISSETGLPVNQNATIETTATVIESPVRKRKKAKDE